MSEEGKRPLQSIAAATKAGRQIAIRSIMRQWPRTCLLRSKQTAWQVNPANPLERLRVWYCAKFCVNVNWMNCKENHEHYCCAKVR